MHELKQFTGYVLGPLAGITYRITPSILLSLAPEKLYRRLYLGFAPYSNDAVAVVCPFVGFEVLWRNARGNELLRQRFAFGHNRGGFGPVDGSTFLPFSRRYAAAISGAAASAEFDLTAGPSAPDALCVATSFPNSTGALSAAVALTLYPYRLTLDAAQVEIEPWFRTDAGALTNIGIVAAVSSDERSN